MGIRLEDLPAKAAQLARELYDDSGGRGGTVRGKSGKYGARAAYRDTGGGKIRFDSQKEARRFDELLVLLRAGAICDLRLQPEFTLVEAFTDLSGRRWRAMRYRADFSYVENGHLVVEDVKSAATRTRGYLDKRKLMRERYGIVVREVLEC